MPRGRPASQVMALLALLALLALATACGLVQQAPLSTGASQSFGPAPTPPVTPSIAPQSSAPPLPPTVAIIPTVMATDNGSTDSWQLLRPGLERRHYNLLTEAGSVRERLYLLRVDPTLFRFDIGYKPGAPQRLMDWQQETGALIVVNGGYFTDDHKATGLVVVDGQITGTSYAGFGGMVAINGGVPTIRSLSQQPYNPYEPVEDGLQSFPLLIKPDGQIGYPDEDGLPDRRTVMAQDRDGRILFILATTGSLTLHELSRYLVNSDLELYIALNLDGGASAGIQLANPVEGVAPYSLLPIVITVRPRN